MRNSKTSVELTQTRGIRNTERGGKQGGSKEEIEIGELDLIRNTCADSVLLPLCVPSPLSRFDLLSSQIPLLRFACFLFASAPSLADCGTWTVYTPETHVIKSQTGTKIGDTLSYTRLCQPNFSGNVVTITCKRGTAQLPNAAWSTAAGAVCSQDCQVSAWRDSTTCSATCGDGSKNQVRDITASKGTYGAPCPALTQTVPCNLGACACPAYHSPSDHIRGVDTGVAVGSTISFTKLGCPTDTTSSTTVVTCRSDFTWSPFVPSTCDNNCRLSSWFVSSDCSFDSASNSYQITENRIVIQAQVGAGAGCDIMERRTSCTGECPNSVTPSGYLQSASTDGNLEGSSIAYTTACQPDFTSTVAVSVCQKNTPGSNALTWSPAGSIECHPNCVLAPSTSEVTCQFYEELNGYFIKDRYTIVQQQSGAGEQCDESLLAPEPCAGQCASYTAPSSSSSSVPTDGNNAGSTVVFTAKCAEGFTATSTEAVCQKNEEGSEKLTWSTITAPSCDADCILGAWTDSSSCAFDSTSNEYSKQQEKHVIQAQTGSGKQCGSSQRSVSCTGTCAPIVVPTGAIQGATSTGNNAGSTTSFTAQCDADFTSSVTTSTCQTNTAGSSELTWSTVSSPTCDADCVLSSWVDSGSCTYFTQGGYLQRQIKNVVQEQTGVGKECGLMRQLVPCSGHCASVEVPSGASLLSISNETQEGSIATFQAECGSGFTATSTFSTCQKTEAGELSWSSAASPSCDADCLLGAWADSSSCAFNSAVNEYQKQQAKPVIQAQTGSGKQCGSSQRSVSCTGTCAPIIVPAGAIQGATSNGNNAGSTTSFTAQCDADHTSTKTTSTCQTNTAGSSELTWSTVSAPSCDANCVLGAWEADGSCSFDSASNSYLQRQSRSPIQAPTGSGKKCDDQVRFVACTGTCASIVVPAGAIQGAISNGNNAGSTTSFTAQCSADFTATTTTSTCGTNTVGSAELTWSTVIAPTCDANCVQGAWVNQGACAFDATSNSYQQAQTRPTTQSPVRSGKACDISTRTVSCTGSCADIAVPTGMIKGACTNGNNEGSTTTFTATCNGGATSSTSTSVCDKTTSSNQLKWSTPAACSCVPPPTSPASPFSSCPPIFSIANGVASSTAATPLGGSVAFSCKPGYLLSQGTAQWKCGLLGIWYSDLLFVRPVCVPSSCPALAAPTNGFLSVSDASGSSFEVKFRCNPGFRLVGQHDEYKCKNGKVTPADQKSHPFPTCVPSRGRRLLQMLEH
jgi:hypothetical protein